MQAEMWNELKVNPSYDVIAKLKARYVNYETNLGEMRSTLSVVAALLATITFAAGFTLPGGLNEETSDAILAKKAIFLVFLLSDGTDQFTYKNDEETSSSVTQNSNLLLGNGENRGQKVASN
ncbi:Ankyrin repeat-containing protein ITN1 [Bienertia sinuspersici]